MKDLCSCLKEEPYVISLNEGIPHHSFKPQRLSKYVKDLFCTVTKPSHNNYLLMGVHLQHLLLIKSTSLLNVYDDAKLTL